MLVRLAAIDEDELTALLKGAWRLSAPKTLLDRLPPDEDGLRSEIW